MRNFTATWRERLFGWRRHLIAWRDRARAERASYSQFGEDEVILRLLEGVDLAATCYVDVGANQPTQLSNTYKLYRRGSRGILIEPNKRLCSLLSTFRPGDLVLNVGCGANSGILRFNVPVHSAAGGFVELPKVNYWAVEYVPILPLDVIAELLPDKYVNCLSVDTEGFDTEVLRGATALLRRTIVLIVEANTEAAGKETTTLLTERGFRVAARTHCNLICVNDEVLRAVKASAGRSIPSASGHEGRTK